MRLIFAGTPVFADAALRALIAAGHEIVLVLTQPDRPAGRGKKLRASPVKLTAVDAELPVFQPAGLRKDPAACQRIADVQADAMVVAAYGLILPLSVLQAPRLGCLNIHASLLPRWRGAAPIQRAIEAGDTQTGITIMQMDEGLDTGPMLLTRQIPIAADDTGASVHDRLATEGAQAIVEALEQRQTGDLPGVAQPAEGATYASRLTRTDALIDWTLTPTELVDRVRAFDPVPGSAGRLAGTENNVKVWKLANDVGAADAVAGAAPGQVISAGADHVIVACTQGAVRVLELQRAGSRRMTVEQFQRGSPINPGDRFELAAPG